MKLMRLLFRVIFSTVYELYTSDNTHLVNSNIKPTKDIPTADLVSSNLDI